MRNSENIKCMKLKETLATRIVSGEFPFNVRFPGVHELVAEYGVSYVTVLKSLKLLEEEGFLQCRRGKGYFTLYADASRRPLAKRINLVLHEECWQCHSAHLEPELSRFKKKRWDIEIVPLKNTDVKEASIAINSPDTYTLIYCLTADWGHFAATFPHISNRVLVIGKLSGSQQITSVICDESETVRQIVDFLQAQGRTRPGIFCCSQENELEMYRLAYWRLALQKTGLELDWIQSHIFPLSAGYEGVLTASQQQEMRRQMTEYLRIACKDMDSIVVTYSRKEFLDACEKVGISVPDALLPVFIASPQWQDAADNTFPLLDHNISAHFETALNILEQRHSTGKKEPGSWYFCSPLGVKSPTR